jgi:hypothetical protein
MPTAQYSWRAMSANPWTSFASRVAASPGERVLGEGVPRVGRDRDRDAQPRPLGQLLEAVVPLRHVTCIRALQQVEVIHQPRGDHVRGLRHGPPPQLLQERAVWVHAEHSVEKHAGFLLERHLPEQVLDAFVDGPARVFIGIEPAIFVQVAESDAVLCKGRRFRSQPRQVAACIDLGTNVLPKVNSPGNDDNDQQKIGKPHGEPPCGCTLSRLTG